MHSSFVLRTASHQKNPTYGSQMVYGDKDLIEDAVEGICDEEKVTWYTNVSRIKRKITDKLGKRAAEQYIIRRGNDGLYRIEAQQYKD